MNITPETKRRHATNCPVHAQILEKGQLNSLVLKFGPKLMKKQKTLKILGHSV